MSEEKDLKQKIQYKGTWDALYILCDAITELGKKISNLEVKIAQNRGYTTEVKNIIKE